MDRLLNSYIIKFVRGDYIDSYLKRLMAENELNYLDDFLDLYDFIPNEDLKTLLAVYHSDMQGAILYS